MTNRINKEQINTLFDYGYSIDLRLIHIGRPHCADGDSHEINDHIAANVINQIMILEHISAKPITINLHTAGGSWCACMAIYDVLKASRCQITIRAMGKLCSSGVWLLQGANQGRRHIYQNTTCLLHDGEDGVSGHPRDIEKYAEQVKKERLHSYRLLAEASGKKADYFNKKLPHDWWMLADDLVKENLADKIIKRNLL